MKPIGPRPTLRPVSYRRLPLDIFTILALWVIVGAAFAATLDKSKEHVFSDPSKQSAIAFSPNSYIVVLDEVPLLALRNGSWGMVLLNKSKPRWVLVPQYLSLS
jgi:hypothetical protein